MTGAILSLLMTILPPLPDGGTVAIKGQRFHTEVAATQEEQTQGLMYRKELAKDHCMFFLYQEDGYHSIWMKNCLISLDVIWVKADGTIVELAQDVPPLSPMFSGLDVPTYGGKTSSRHFIELPVGTIKRLGIKSGDRISWDLRLPDGTLFKGGVSAKAAAVKSASKSK